MAKLIFETAIHQDANGQLASYWPELWPLDILARKWLASGSAFFAASYMNDPSALEGNSLKTEWVHCYTDAELVAARIAADVSVGVIHAGIDPAQGGKSADPDDMAVGIVEIIDNRGYLRGYLAGKYPVEEQAQRAEDYLDLWHPAFVNLEETSTRGYVYASFTTQINSGRGTKWPIVVQKPQGARDKGGKGVRLQAMAARFENGQVRIPGIIQSDGTMTPHHDFEAFLQQWRAFPAGHDDILDSFYWAIYNAFTTVQAGAVAREATQIIKEADKEVVVPATSRRGTPLRPMGQQRPRARLRWRDSRMP